MQTKTPNEPSQRIHHIFGSIDTITGYRQCNLRFNLRTFARKFSDIDFFLQILPLKDDELVMSEM